MVLLAEPPGNREHSRSRAAAWSTPEATHGRRSMSWALGTGTRLDRGAAPGAGLSGEASRDNISLFTMGIVGEEI